MLFLVSGWPHQLHLRPVEINGGQLAIASLCGADGRRMAPSSKVVMLSTYKWIDWIQMPHDVIIVSTKSDLPPGVEEDLGYFT